MDRPKTRLGTCEVCQEAGAKYTCPACECITCSLICSKKHKKDTDCDGVRVRTSFVKLNEFGNLDLLSDYRLLDSISCKVDSCHRDKLKKAANIFQQPYNKSNKLRQAVLSRGADFVSLPNQFLRHKNNSSFFDTRTKQIKWKVQLTFLNATRFTIYDNRCSEETILSSLVEKVMMSPDAFPKLESYKKSGLDALTVLMKAERVPAADKKFYKLNMRQNLKENFVGKTIVEFPQLFVIINGFFASRKPSKRNSNIMRGKADANLLLTSINQDKLSENSRKRNYETLLSSTSEESGEEEDFHMEIEIGTKLPSYRDLIL